MPRWTLALASLSLVASPFSAAASGPFPGYFEQYPSARVEAWFGVAADLDRDGRSEYVTGWWDYSRRSYSQVRWFPAGMWESSTTTVIQVSATSDYLTPGPAAAADLDGDNDLDLLIPIGDSLVMLPLISPGVFGPAIREYVPGIGRVAAADLDGDGLVDIAATTYPPQRVQILLATAPFTFIAFGEYPTRVYVEGLDVADFNEDLVPDLLVAADTASTLLLGDGTGLFAASEIPIAGAVSAGDLNGDGRVDAFTRSAAYLGNGDGTFQSALPFQALVAAVTTDLDEDGRLDLVGIRSMTPFFQMSVQLGLGDGTFGPATLQPYGRGGTNSVQAGDFDGDGHQDVVQPSRYGMDGLLFGAGNGRFLKPRLVPAGMQVRFLEAGEFDRQPGEDLLVVSRAANSMRILHRTGLAQWTPTDSLLLPGIPAARGPELADLNGDGRDDVVLAYDDLSTISYWLTGPSGVPGTRIDLPSVDAIYPRTIEIAVGDVDDDGAADILYQRQFDGGVQYDGLPLGWYRGLGDGTFTYRGTLPYIALRALEIGDLSGDGVPDLAMMNRAYGIRVVIATAPGVFGAYTDLAPVGSPFYAEHFVVGRLDDDAFTDLALFNHTTSVFRGNGDGSFAAAYGISAAGAFGTAAYANDLDGDGRDEIVSGSTVIRFTAAGGLDGAVTYGVWAAGAAESAARSTRTTTAPSTSWARETSSRSRCSSTSRRLRCSRPRRQRLARRICGSGPRRIQPAAAYSCA